MNKIQLDRTEISEREESGGGDTEGSRQNHQQQQSTFEDITTPSFMDDDYNQVLLEMDDLEKFFADERWQQRRELTESERRLLIDQLQSLLENAPVSSPIHPTERQIELEYYNLVKILERIQDEMDQSESIEIVARIREEEEEEEKEDEEPPEENGNWHNLPDNHGHS